MKEITEMKLFDAFIKAVNLSLNANVLTETFEPMLTKANLQPIRPLAKVDQKTAEQPAEQKQETQATEQKS